MLIAKNWQELKKPSSLEIKDADRNGRKATFLAEPLERGFGMTLGNSLRRVLLSSLQGASRLMACCMNSRPSPACART